MSLMEKVRLIPRVLKADTRGWFLKVIDGSEEGLPNMTGEVYLTLARPGQVRGNHYHLLANEWFTVVQGTAQMILADTITGERVEMVFTGSSPATLFVPARIAHAFKNPENSTDPMLLVAYSDQLYDPGDTIQHILV